MRSATRRHRRRAHNRTLIIRLKRANAPVRILEHLRVLSNILLARVHAAQPGVHGAPRAGVHIAGPVAAEGVCEDEALVHEALLDVAGALEVCVGRAELGGVGLAGLETLGGAAAGEEPDLDAVGLPLRDVVAALVGVEAGAVGGRIGVVDVAARGA